MGSLKEEIRVIARERGIDKVGFTSEEHLEDAPPSGNLRHVLPSARSAISLTVALDKDAIRGFLGKKDHVSHVNDHRQSYIRLEEAAKAIQGLLRDRGHEASTPYPNFQYRKGLPFMAMAPPLSHRYVAVASGIGWLGWSGNVITPEYGASVSLSTVVTSAELEPDPLVEGESCKDCHLCVATCPTYFMSKKEETKVSIAGRVHVYNKKASNLRCIMGCGSVNGVTSRDAKWSTWAYGVLDLPGPDDDEAFEQRVHEYARDPNNKVLRAALFVEMLELSDWEMFNMLADDMPLTCGNCMLVCWPDMKDRKENYRLLTTSGRVVKDKSGLRVIKSDGSYEVIGSNLYSDPEEQVEKLLSYRLGAKRGGVTKSSA